MSEWRKFSTTLGGQEMTMLATFEQIKDLVNGRDDVARFTWAKGEVLE